MNQWNLSVQRQLGKDWLVSANYVGNSTIHMISGENINPAVFLGTGACCFTEAPPDRSVTRFVPLRRISRTAASTLS